MSKKVAGVFETFKVEDKIKELKALFQDGDLDVLNGANVVIAVPSFDESERSIFKHDQDLFVTQRRDAYRLIEFFLEETRACVAGLVLDADKTIEIARMQIDYVIFLHEFMVFERDYILGVLSDYGYGRPRVVELY